MAPVMATVSFVMKSAIVHLIRRYQELAPDRVRKSCRFEPTCSNYMLKAIEKYGVSIGLYRGVKRLFRCRPPNGGCDYP